MISTRSISAPLLARSSGDPWRIPLAYASGYYWPERSESIRIPSASGVKRDAGQGRRARLRLRHAGGWPDRAMIAYDYLVVGGGMFGAVFARRAAECGQR